MRARRRVRWDRLGRVAMLGVLATISYLYLSAGVTLVSTWSAAKRDGAQVAALERQNAQLQAQHTALQERTTLIREARALGMQRPGEQVYVVQGLPAN
jgi:cell division protein FtsB